METLKPGMTKPEITRCSDNHFRRVIYSLAAYIADYPEQVLLACVVQGWCAKYIFSTSTKQPVYVPDLVVIDVLLTKMTLTVAAAVSLAITSNYWSVALN